MKKYPKDIRIVRIEETDVEWILNVVELETFHGTMQEARKYAASKYEVVRTNERRSTITVA